jgi:hypothetical protein
MELVVDNGAPEELPSSCAGTWGASSPEADGYYYAGGPPGAPHGLAIEGCASAMAKSVGVQFAATNGDGPGTYSMGTIQYTDGNGSTWGVSGDSFTLIVTQGPSFGTPGGAFDGTFTANVSHGGNAAHMLSGSFHVCHVHDLLAP